jgi:hypothetical protein
MWAELKPQHTKAFLSTFGVISFFFPGDQNEWVSYLPQAAVRFGAKLPQGKT